MTPLEHTEIDRPLLRINPVSSNPPRRIHRIFLEANQFLPSQNQRDRTQQESTSLQQVQRQIPRRSILSQEPQLQQVQLPHPQHYYRLENERPHNPYDTIQRISDFIPFRDDLESDSPLSDLDYRDRIPIPESLQNFQPMTSPPRQPLIEYNRMPPQPILSEPNPSIQRYQATIVALFLISMMQLPIYIIWRAQSDAFIPILQTFVPSRVIQFIRILGPLAGIIVGPTIGVISDNCGHKWGRRRPYLVYGCISTIMSLTCIYYVKEIAQVISCEENDQTSHCCVAMLAVFLYTWLDVTIYIMQIPAWLLLSDFAGDRQVLGFSFSQGWTLIGSILITTFVKYVGNIKDHLPLFMLSLCLVLMAVVTIVCLIGNEEQKQFEFDIKLHGPGCIKLYYASGSILNGLIELRQPLSIFAILVLFVLYGLDVFEKYKKDFLGINVLNGEAEGADSCFTVCSQAQLNYQRGIALATDPIIDLLTQVCGLGYLIGLPVLVAKIGGKAMLTFSILPMVSLMAVVESTNLWFVITVGVLTKLTATTISSLLVPMVAHVMDKNTDIGIFVGSLNSATCFAQILNIFVGDAIVNTSLGYALPIYTAGVFGLASLLICIWLVKVDLRS